MHITTLKRIFPRRNVQSGGEQPSFIPLTASLLRPVDLLAARINGDSHTPILRILPVGVRSSALVQFLETSAIEIATEQAHALSVAPVDFTLFRIDFQLLRGPRRTMWDDRAMVFPVQVKAIDGAVILLGVSHSGIINLVVEHTNAVCDVVSIGRIRFKHDDGSRTWESRQAFNDWLQPVAISIAR